MMNQLLILSFTFFLVILQFTDHSCSTNGHVQSVETKGTTDNIKGHVKSKRTKGTTDNINGHVKSKGTKGTTDNIKGHESKGTTDNINGHVKSEDLNHVIAPNNVTEALLQKHLNQFVPPLNCSHHKGVQGRVGVIGGSSEYTGATYFAAASALRCGADLAYVFSTKSSANVLRSFKPDMIGLPYLDDTYAFPLMNDRVAKMHSLVIGPGLGEDKKIFERINLVISHLMQAKINRYPPLIMDADGIKFLCQFPDLLYRYEGDVYLTPNANELKLLEAEFNDTSHEKSPSHETSEVSQMRSLAAKINPNAIIIVKGPRDKIVTPHYYVECTVHGTLRRCGGQGDILAGTLAQFSHWAEYYDKIKRRKDPEISKGDFSKLLAAYAACSITRMAGGAAFKLKGRGMLASDMLEHLQLAVERCSNSSF